MNNRSLLSLIINSILILLILNVGFLKAQASDPEIKIHYLGHSAFVLRFDNGINIVTDYGKENAWVQWGWDSPINDIGDLVPDVMTFSHQHEDHYDPTRIPPGVPNILTNLDSLLIDGITIRPIRTCETDINIESNTSFIFSYKGLTICHLGDAQAQIMNISDTIVKDKIIANFPDQFDLLFMTIDGQQQFIPQAEAFVELLNPKRIIPMHHWSENYLQDFLNHLTDQNNTGSNYQINEIGNAKYDLSLNEIVDPIQVISLTREPYYIEANVGIENDDYYSNYKLKQNYTNPFNPTTTIEYYLPKAEDINISIFNLLGDKVTELYNGSNKVGIHRIDLTAGNMPSGISLYQLTSKNFKDIKTCMLLK